MKENNSLFIVVLKYIVPIEVIDRHRPQHLEFLDECYANGYFVASGPQIPRSGGIIIARRTTKKELEEILKNDPFHMQNLAEYQIYEFDPVKCLDALKQLL